MIFAESTLDRAAFDWLKLLFHTSAFALRIVFDINNVCKERIILRLIEVINFQGLRFYYL